MVRRYQKELSLVFSFTDRAAVYEDRKLSADVLTSVSEFTVIPQI